MSYDPEQPHWSIMTKSRGGTVSVIRNLTLREVKQIYERLDPDYGRDLTQFVVHKDFLPEGTLSSVRSAEILPSARDGDIEIRKVFGPPGWEGFAEGEMEDWPKITSVYVDQENKILPDEYQSDPGEARVQRLMREKWARRDDLEDEAASRSSVTDTHDQPKRSRLACFFDDFG